MNEVGGDGAHVCFDAGLVLAFGEVPLRELDVDASRAGADAEICWAGSSFVFFLRFDVDGYGTGFGANGEEVLQRVGAGDATRSDIDDGLTRLNAAGGALQRAFRKGYAGAFLNFEREVWVDGYFHIARVDIERFHRLSGFHVDNRSKNHAIHGAHKRRIVRDSLDFESGTRLNGVDVLNRQRLCNGDGEVDMDVGGLVSWRGSNMRLPRNS